MTYQSLLNIRTDDKCTIYFQCHPNEQVIPTQLRSNNMTIDKAIVQTIQTLNHQHNLQLTKNYSQYTMFIARKNGLKKDDCPALEGKQIISKIRYNRFYLQLIKIPNQMSSQNSLSIQLDFTSKTKKKQIADKLEQYGCFCIKK